MSFDLSRAAGAVARDGFAVVPGVLDAPFLADVRAAMYRLRDAIEASIGAERLARAGERGTLRLPFAFEPIFFRFLEIPELLAWVDATVGPTAILHLQNAFILAPASQAGDARIFQNTFHRDFPRYLNGYVASTNVMFAVDEYSAATGATLAVPGTHARAGDVDDAWARERAVPIEAPPGSMILFDSTLWHAAGENTSTADRLSINHQFTRPWIKQQIDYVRAVGDATIATLPQRTQQLLGWYTRVVTNLDEYYQPEERRLYRRGQG